MSRDGPAKGPARARDQAGASRGPPVAGRLRHGSAPRSSLPPPDTAATGAICHRSPAWVPIQTNGGGGWHGDGGPHDGRDLGEGREPPTVRLLNFPVLGVAAPAGPGRRSPQLCPPTAPRGGAAHPMFPFRGQRGQRSPWGASPPPSAPAVPAGPARSWLQDEGPRVSTPLPGPGPRSLGLG